MSEMIKVTGKTVEDAITTATIKLGVTSDKIVYNVLEHESKGFLGLGAKDAVIEVRLKTEADYEVERLAKKAEEEAAKQAALQEAEQAKEAAPSAAEPADDAAEEAVPEEKEEETESAPAAQEHAEAEEEPSYRKRERVIVPLEDPSEAIAKAEGFLRDIYKAMGMDVELLSDYDGEILNIRMDGEDMGILIGKRGQTLDSLQYLVSLVVNKGSDTYVRVKLDTENYRERRKATLENLAKNIAVKVKKGRQPVYLEPMNPYERRIIHSALQNDPFVTTHSEGEEPDRKVVVTLKKDADLSALDRKYGERSSRGGRGGYRSGGRRNDRRGGYRNGGRKHDDEKMEPVRLPEEGSAFYAEKPEQAGDSEE